MSDWRMDRMCENCPFQSKGPGLKLRRSLRPGRWREILLGLRMDQHFYCHKTTEEDDEGEFVHTPKARLCAGAIAWQEARGLSSQYQRVCERLEALRSKPKKETKR